MSGKDIELKDKIVKQAIRSVRRNRKVDVVSLLAISKELNVDFSEITKYYSSMEDIFLKHQKKNWKSTYKSLNRKVKKAKTPGDFKSIFDEFLEEFVSGITADADLHWEVCSFIPICLEWREANKKVFASKMKSIINQGWPGKNDNVLDRQTDLFLFCFFGFVDLIVHKPVKERAKILKDFRNMLNLHLQDRLFF